MACGSGPGRRQHRMEYRWAGVHGKYVRLIVPKCTKVAQDARGSGVGAIGGGGGRGEGVRLCHIGRGLYEGSCALLATRDFVMSPTGKGPLSDGPLHPRAPGGVAPLVPPSSSCTAFLPPPASLRRWRASGDLPTGMRCAPTSRRHGVARVPLQHVSCAASPRRQLPFGAKRLRAICHRCRRCARNSRHLDEACVPLRRVSCTAFLSSPASLRRRAPLGDLATGMRCAPTSRRHGVARVPLQHVSCAASPRRQLPFGAKRLRAICHRCRRCARNSRHLDEAYVPLRRVSCTAFLSLTAFLGQSAFG